MEAARQYVLRARAPVPLVVLGAVLVAVGFGLIAWAPSGAPLIIGAAVAALGLAALAIAVVRVLGGRQRITLDDVGIRVAPPRPTDIAWDEVTAVRESGRMLHIELRDHTRFVVNGEVYRRGYPEFQSALVDRLSARPPR